MASDQGRGSHYWHLLGQHFRNGPGVWLWLGLPQPIPRSRPTASTCTSHSCSYSRTIRLWGESAGPGSGEKIRLEGTEPAWMWLLGVLPQHLRTCPCPFPQRLLATKQRRNLSSYLAWALASPSLALPSTKLIASSRPWVKTWFMLMPEPALSPKPPGTYNKHLYQPLLFWPQGHSFKTRISSCFT